MKRFNLHSHSLFCDGKSSLEQMVCAAIEKGFYCFGFSAHAPVPFENNFALPFSDIQSYLDETHRLKEKYQSKIRLYTSMEFDYITDIAEDAKQRAKDMGLDYVLASVHQVKQRGKEGVWFIDGGKQEVWDKGLEACFGGDVRKGVECFYSQSIEMLQKVNPDVICHFDKVKMHNKERFFSEKDAWYKELVRTLLEQIKTQDCICEVNTRGLYKGRSNDFFPSLVWIKESAQMGIRMTISTDCHNASEVDLYFDEAVEALKQCGHRYVWYFDGQWQAEKLP
ncbi:MAG: histidinol-phosphatase [Candidatus Onthomorpha sp.]|nr:histidinol-phosphatase [Candidatus Onthomorpha sp.]